MGSLGALSGRTTNCTDLTNDMLGITTVNHVRVIRAIRGWKTRTRGVTGTS